MVKVVLSTSVIFLVIVAVRKFFRGKAGNVFLYSLWLLFVAGLIAPVFSVVLLNVSGGGRGRVESPVSIMNLVKAAPFHADSKEVSVKQREGIAEKREWAERKTGDAGKVAAGGGNAADRNVVQKQAVRNGFQDWMELLQFKYILLFIWAVGAIVILLFQFQSEKSFRRQLTENREEINYQGQRVYVAGGIKTPLLFRSRGLSPEIYLPEMIMENETLIRHAILHENIHRGHGDIWWGYVRNILVAVYWFYPLVWIAAVLSKRDCEYACDSSVMKDMSREERISYGNSLLSLIQLGEKQDLFCSATTMKIGKSEMEVRIRMIKRGRKRNIFATVFILLLICVVGVVAFTDAMSQEKEPVKEQKISLVQREQIKALSAKEAEYKLTDIYGADEPYIYYEDDTKMIFSGYFGLFVYSKETEEIVQSLDLKEIGCNMTQGSQYCEISVSTDGKTAYLHVKNDKKMYQYSIDTKELQYLDYKLPEKLYNRKKWEKTQKSGIQSIRCSTIGDLVYWYEDGGMIKYQPLFYMPYGPCEFFKPDEIRDLSEVSFYVDGREYVITEERKLKWIEKHFSDSAEEIGGQPACPFYRVMYLKRKDGKCGKIFPATDSCSVYQTGEAFYDYKEKTNEVFWELFGIDDVSTIK